MTTKKHDEEAAEETKAAAKPKAKKPAPEPASGKEAVAENGAATAEPAAEHPAKKEPKERTFVDAKTGKAIAHPHLGGSGAEANQAAREEMHSARNGSALPFRIGAAVLWVLGIVCEIMAVLVMNGTLFLPGPGASTWLIIFLVVTS